MPLTREFNPDASAQIGIGAGQVNATGTATMLVKTISEALNDSLVSSTMTQVGVVTNVTGEPPLPPVGSPWSVTEPPRGTRSIAFFEGNLYWALIAASVAIFFLLAFVVRKIRSAHAELDSITFSEYQCRLQDLDFCEQLRPMPGSRAAIDRWLATSSIDLASNAESPPDENSSVTDNRSASSVR
eukprot:TRINITY_DN7557_c0_g1_i1.p1 TRINITY_DN7557_c0_g1~~TRINITY_DN7557_c0_g1_i1.p1  ORF type:complete len:185 (+),score=11.95 TRINITY_DN7557_c0_g1_i1:168-722(+)